ncbi:MAG: exodeoxyribonuclease III [Acidobacteriota bacterium]
MKIATWNINSINSRLQHVLDWSEKNEPDVLCLQETKCVDAKFPEVRLRSVGFAHQKFFGEKSYNGVAILSRHPIRDLRKGLPGSKGDTQTRLIAGTVNGVRIVNTYVPHGSGMGTEKYQFKLDWLGRLRRFFDKQYDQNDLVLLCGDLNIAPHDLDVWKVSAWINKLHFTKPERDALLKVKKWGFVDVFRQMNDAAGEFSWWDYYYHSFEKNRGLRIDHIWATEPLAELCTDCWIDREPRAAEKPSDHAPVVAEFQL